MKVVDTSALVANARPLFRDETAAELGNTLSSVYVDRDISRHWEAYVLVAGSVMLVLAAMFTRISLDVTASGIIRANTNNRVLVADRDGILAYIISNRLPVDVQKGTKIASIKNFDPVTLRQAPSISFSRTEREARRARLLERQQTAKIATESKIESLRLMQAQLQNLKADSDSLAAAYRDDVERLGKRQDVYRQLLNKGLINSQVLETATESVSERTFQMNNAQSSAHEYERRSTELEFQLRQTSDDGNREQMELRNQLNDIDVAMEADAELEERPLYAEDAVTLIPRGFSTGQAVKRGDALFEMNSPTEALEVEADVPESQIGELHEGMPVTIGVSSYPFFKYGMVNGTVAFVSSVSTETVAFNERLPNSSQFRMIIKPDPASIAVFSKDKKLLPGMLTEVHVRKKKVAIWRLLLSPLLRLGYRTDI